MTRQNTTHLPQDFTRLLEMICEISATLLGATASSVFLREGDRVVMRAAFGYSQSLVHKARYQLGEGITGWIADGNEFMANSKKELENHRSHKGKYDREIWGGGGHRCGSLLGLPLYIGDDVYGLIKVENESKPGGAARTFTPADLEILRIFLRAISDAIQTNSELMAALGRLHVFVLMPFNEGLTNIYKLAIKPAALQAGMRCDRVDQTNFNDDILQQIYTCISNAHIVIAVMTGKSPNVLYETGYSHAMGKATVLLAADKADIPFDLAHYNHIIYNPNDIEALQKCLEERLLAAKSRIRGITRSKASVTKASKPNAPGPARKRPTPRPQPGAAGSAAGLSSAVLTRGPVVSSPRVEARGDLGDHPGRGQQEPGTGPARPRHGSGRDVLPGRDLGEAPGGLPSMPW